MMQKKIMTVTLNPCMDKTITLPVFCEGGLNRAQETRTDAGGKGINVAKVLKRLGAEVLAVGVLGSRGSEAFKAELAKREIPSLFHIVPGETRTNYKLFDSEKHQVTEINEPGFSVCEADVQAVFSLIEKQLESVEVLILAGSMAPGFPADTYKRLSDLGKEKGVKVIVDADGENLLSALEAMPYAVKPNRFELEQLMQKPLPDDEALCRAGNLLLDKGVSLVVISLGAEGAIYLSGQERYRVTIPPVECQSTVGSGDSMVAAVAYCLASESSLEALAKMASAAGTATALKPGSEVCTREEVFAFQEKVIVEML